MMNIQITSSEWTTAEMTSDWAEDEALTVEQAAEAADTQSAWLILHTHERLAGWSFTPNGFSGPARSDAVDEIMSLITESVDYVLAHMDEITAEAA